MSRSLVITPTYNERGNLAAFLDGLFEVDGEVDCLIVDDASPDGTGALAAQIASVDPRVHVMHRAGKLGLGTAYLDGFRWALERGYPFIFEMDTDLSHDPKYLPEFRRAFDRGADVVIGSRNITGGGVDGWGVGRHLLSKGGSLYSRLMLNVEVRDLTSGYKGFRAEVLRAIGLDRVRSEGYGFQVEMTYRALRQGFRVVEVPIVFTDRRAGESKMSKRIFVEAVMTVPKLRLEALRGKL